eukprot:COSAG01_NODE_2822_length_7009_cov_3.862663_9_plen_209_part_00
MSSDFGRWLLAWLMLAVLRHANAMDRAFQFYPLMVTFTLLLNLFLIVYHGTGATKSWSLGMALLASFLPSVAVGLAVQFVLLPRLRAQAAADAESTSGLSEALSAAGSESAMADGAAESPTPEHHTPDSQPLTAALDAPSNESSLATSVKATTSNPVQAAVDGDAALAARDAAVEVFDPKAEWVFKYHLRAISIPTGNPDVTEISLHF